MSKSKKYYDYATLIRAVRLIRETKLTLLEICKELHTSLPVLIRNMNWYFNIPEIGENAVDWKKMYATKRSIDKRKKNVRIVYECAMCGGESEIKIKPCQKCGSYCVNRRELRNEISAEELRSANMTGQRNKN